MKKKLAYTLCFAFAAVAFVSFYLFITLHNNGNFAGSNNAFVIGFLSIATGYILLPTQPVALANQKGLRVRYWNYLNK